MTVLHDQDREEMRQLFIPTQKYNQRVHKEALTSAMCDEACMSCHVQPTYTSHATHVFVVEWCNLCTGIFCQFVEGLS